MINTNMFDSRFEARATINLPMFSNTRVMMMPIELGDIESVPDSLNHWKPSIYELFLLSDCKEGVGYLTIDEKIVKAGATHRRAGKHVDGVYKGKAGPWAGDGGGGWGSAGAGMLTVANVVGCKAWNQAGIEGFAGYEGEADHLASQLKEESATLFQPNMVYWVDGFCIHESLPMEKDCERQFVRLSMPSKAPWFEGYTVNPLGVKPTGPILARRNFMDM